MSTALRTTTLLLTTEVTETDTQTESKLRGVFKVEDSSTTQDTLVAEFVLGNDPEEVLSIVDATSALIDVALDSEANVLSDAQRDAMGRYLLHCDTLF